MDLPDYIDTLVDHNDPETLALSREAAEGYDLLIAMLKGAKDPKARAKELGITPEDLGFTRRVEHDETREQIITRSFIEDTSSELRCRVDRTHSKVTITKRTITTLTRR